MQIFVLGIVTISLLLSFQSLTAISTTPASAANGGEIRVYNNFQQESRQTARDQNQFIQEVTTPTSQDDAELAQAQTTNTALYTVQMGDTLNSVATDFETTAQILSSLNNVTQQYTPQAGDVIRVRAE